MQQKKIRVLWLSALPGLRQDGGSGYNGGGWIASLQRVVMQCPEIELALAYSSHGKEEKAVEDGCTYYPVYAKPLTAWQKLRHYYGGYRHIDENAYVEELKRVIDDYRPDVIHLFGLECPFATILGRADVPVIVSLQGFLGPCSNAFWPIGMNHSTFNWPPTWREMVVRNGYRYAKKSIDVRGRNERRLFKNVRHCMGRTEWDFQVSRLMSPGSQYYHVDEVLRPVFYDNEGKWKQPATEKFVITSTISQTIYKGLDFVLRTAELLESETGVDFEWRVVGVDGASAYVRFFEKYTGIHSERVRYMGVMSADEICHNLLETNLYVHPSYIDNSPNSVCEAQLLGVPVAAANVGGVASLVEHSETGILVPANGPYELAYHIQVLAQMPELAESLGQSGQIRAAQRHDQPTILFDLIDAYKQVIAYSQKHDR